MNSSITSLSSTPGKHKWYDQFQKHNLILNKSKAKMLIVGDSLVLILSRYPEIWRKYFSNHEPLNFGIAGDKAQNVLWRVNNLYFSSNLHLKYIFILCGTIISTSLWSFKRRVTNFKLLLYHFYRATINTQEGIVNTVNKLLKLQCLNNGFYFLQFKPNWLN